MNHIIWLLGLLILAYLVRHCYICPGRLLKKRHTEKKNNSCVVFDLHGVLLERDYFGIIKHIFKHAYRFDLVLMCVKPSFLKDVVKLFKKSRVPEEFIIELSQKHKKLLPFVDVIIAIMNEQRIIPSTFEVIKKLKNNGYSLYIFSNIGEKTFEKLEQKFPELFAYFDGIGVVEQQDDWIQKPYPTAFTKFLARFGLNAHECIFIDNNHTNIKTALKEGFYPILYQTPGQLTYELQAIDLLRL